MHMLLNPIVEMISQSIQISNHHRDSVCELSFLSYSSRLGMQEGLAGFRHVSVVEKAGFFFFQFQREGLRRLVPWLVSLKAHVKHLLLIICRIIKHSFEAFTCLALTHTAPVSASLFCDALWLSWSLNTQ